MNYFLREIARWPKGYFVLIAFMFISFLSIISGFTGAFGNLVFILYAILIAGLLLYGIVAVKIKRANRAWERELAALEATLAEGLKSRLQQQPGYQTPCHVCCHYDTEVTGCRLHLPGKMLFHKLDPSSPFQYCLFWNHRFPEKFYRYLVAEKKFQR